MTEKPNATENMQITEIRVFEGLPPAAQRALEEAEARRAAEKEAQAPREIGGRGGKDPARFGDWEIKGRTIDF
ncbi:DUF1674 domain-containing protein [Ochrobactrum sp. CM-21-5]|nr:DUF1674 domain-containing protein [Ochrobactrum sp. CM-21-5]MBC2887392.1 DUF1674 domain-containing protein [Ochrobactrum sp. CM-21-5]